MTSFDIPSEENCIFQISKISLECVEIMRPVKSLYKSCRRCKHFMDFLKIF